MSLTVAAIVIAASVAVPLLDSGPVDATTHIEQPHGKSCFHYQHDHLACQLFQANPLVAASVQRSAFAEIVHAAQPLPTPVHSTAQVRNAPTRSRAPPRA